MLAVINLSTQNISTRLFKTARHPRRAVTNKLNTERDTIMFGLGGQELLIILAIVTVLFGAKKLPLLGSSLAKGITNFKSGINEEKKDKEIESSEV